MEKGAPGLTTQDVELRLHRIFTEAAALIGILTDTVNEYEKRLKTLSKPAIPSKNVESKE